MSNKVNINEVQSGFIEDANNLTRVDAQYISPRLLDDLRDSRNQSKATPEGDYMHVASIPVIFVDKWKREGFDIMKGDIPIQHIIKKLKAENLDGFMATEKSI